MLKFTSKLTDSAESIQARLDRSLKEACEAVTNGAKAKYGTDIAIKTKRLIRTQPTEDWSFIAVVDFALAPKVTITTTPGKALQAEGRLAIPRQAFSNHLRNSFDFRGNEYEVSFYGKGRKLLKKEKVASLAEFDKAAASAALQGGASVEYVEAVGWGQESHSEKSEHFDASEFASKIEREFHKEANTSFKLAGANVLSVDVSAQHNVAQVKASIRLKPAARPIRSETVTRLVR